MTDSCYLIERHRGYVSKKFTTPGGVKSLQLYAWRPHPPVFRCRCQNWREGIGHIHNLFME